MSALFEIPDPTPWRVLARVLADQAEALRVEARRIAAATAAARWHSPASRVFVTRADQAALQAVRVACGIDNAADLARRRAADLEAVAAALGRTS